MSELREKIREILNRTISVKSVNKGELYTSDGCDTLKLEITFNNTDNELATLISHERAEHDKQVRAAVVGRFSRWLMGRQNTAMT